MGRQNEINKGLRGFPFVRSLEFSVDLDTGCCTMFLDLTESERKGAKAIRVEFLGVSNLFLRDFGGGLTQLLLLAVEDISDRQLDRINYEVKELERESISLLCQAVNISNLS